MTTVELFKHFGYDYPYNSALDRFNGAFLEFEYFLDQKYERLMAYVNNRNASPIVVELGNYEIAKCYEFADVFMEIITDTNEEIERDLLYGLEVALFGPQRFHGKELQQEINLLKIELGL